LFETPLEISEDQRSALESIPTGDGGLTLNLFPNEALPRLFLPLLENNLFGGPEPSPPQIGWGLENAPLQITGDSGENAPLQITGNPGERALPQNTGNYGEDPELARILCLPGPGSGGTGEGVLPAGPGYARAGGRRPSPVPDSPARGEMVSRGMSDPTQPMELNLSTISRGEMVRRGKFDSTQPMEMFFQSLQSQILNGHRPHSGNTAGGNPVAIHFRGNC